MDFLGNLRFVTQALLATGFTWRGLLICRPVKVYHDGLLAALGLRR